MNSMNAHWSQPTADDPGAGHRRTIASSADIDNLMSDIAEPLAEEAILYHSGRALMEDPFTPGGDEVPDHELSVAARDQWAYLRIWTMDDDDRWILDGDPESPAFVQGNSEFPAGSGLPRDRVAEAVQEFLTTAALPTATVTLVAEA